MRFLNKKLLVAVATLFTLATTSVGAQAPDMMIAKPFPAPNPTGFLGQTHDYSVTFRGNGEAVVSTRVAFTNSTNNLKNDFELRLPLQAQISEPIAFQVIKEAPCIRYTTQPVYDPTYLPTCAEYGQVDYFQPYYGTNLYQKAEITVEGDVLKIKLPKAVESQKSGAFFVYYRTMGMTSKSMFGGFSYDFETAKVNESIQTLNIGISTDADQYLKGANGSVDYRFSADSAKLSAPMAMGAEAQTSPQIDQFYNQIGYGSINKNASNLAAMESYKVSGSFADSKLKLYAKEIAIGVGVLFVIVILMLLFASFVARRLNRRPSDSTETDKPARSGRGGGVLLAFAVSLISSVFVAIYSVGLIIFMQMLSGSFVYQFQEGVQYMYFIVLIISFVIYIVAIVVPAIFIGIKRGLGLGILTLVLTVIWIVLVLVVVAAFLFFFQSRRDMNIVRPYDTFSTKAGSAPMPEVQEVDTPTSIDTQ